MKIPEHCSHTIEKLFERNVNRYEKKKITYDILIEKMASIIRYALDKGYAKNDTLLVMMYDKLNSSKKWRREYAKRNKLAEKEYLERLDDIGPYPAIPWELAKSLSE